MAGLYFVKPNEKYFHGGRGIAGRPGFIGFFECRRFSELAAALGSLYKFLVQNGTVLYNEAMKKAAAINPKAAIGYVRVSTQEQADMGVSLAAQEARIRAYCQVHGLELVELVIEEGVSAFTPLADRPAGFLARLKARRAAHVVGLKLDRLFRNAEDALRVTREWDEAGVGLHLVDMGGQSVNTRTAMGKMWLTMLAGFAEFERGLTSERTAAALAHKKANGEAYGPTPYGFQRVEDELVADKAERKVVDKILARRAAGQTLRAIAEWLNTAGIPTKQGGRWYASTVKYLTDNTLYQGA